MIHMSRGPQPIAWRSAAAVLLFAAVLPIVGTARVAADAGDPPITGLVFEDVDADGQRQLGEALHRTYTVTAYAADGTSTAGVVNADGTFTIDVAGLDPAGTLADAYRVEVTGPLGSGYVFGPVGSGADPGLPQGGTSVQFAAPGDSLAVSVQIPGAFCQNNPVLVTACFANGHQLSGPNSGRDVVVSVPSESGAEQNLNANGSPLAYQIPNPPGHVALANEIGSTWGSAWNRSSNYLYQAAFLKQISGYGPAGPNAIYRIPMDPYTSLATGPPEPWVVVD